LKSFLSVCLALALSTAASQAFPQAHQPPKVEVDDYQWQYTENPFKGDAEEVERGRSLYRRTCYICHLDAGGRGPDLRKSGRKGQDFIRIMLNGKKNTQMPAWKGKLSEADMWRILTYLEAPPAQ
jgi:mono/diheme cytochrome c family protein